MELQIKHLLSILLIILASCGNEKTDTKLSHVEPYSIEYFEVETTPDTSIYIYFNRNVSKNDVSLKITPIYMEDSINNLPPCELIFSLKNSKNNKLKIDYPLKLNSEILKLNSRGNIERFNSQILLQISGTKKYTYVNLIPKFPNCPNNRIMANGHRLYWIKDILKFKPTKEKNELNINDFNKGMIWRKDFWKYYEGELDDNGSKNGKWIWKYSNGNILASADFLNDTVSTVLKVYSFKGQLIDSIPAGDERLRKEKPY